MFKKKTWFCSLRSQVTLVYRSSDIYFLVKSKHVLSNLVGKWWTDDIVFEIKPFSTLLTIIVLVLPNLFTSMNKNFNTIRLCTFIECVTKWRKRQPSKFFLPHTFSFTAFATRNYITSSPDSIATKQHLQALCRKR